MARLERESGFKVAVAADESVGPIDCGSFPKVSVTRRAAGRLGLYCPRDFAWRCGDYSLYLARRVMPEIEHFWQIEPDVRVAYADYADFFRVFEPYPNVDLIGFDLGPSAPDHYWYPTMRRKTRDVYRCIFALTRFSARAVDVCEAERQRDFYNGWARLYWPNDETFTSTTLAAAGLNVRDANSFGHTLYSRETFGYATVFPGENFEATAQDGLVYHPVLWADDYGRKVATLRRGPRLRERVRIKLLRASMIEDDRRRAGLGRFFARRRPIACPPRPPSRNNVGHRSPNEADRSEALW